MSLDETARNRLQDVRELQPTSNGELADRWGMSSGKEVATYLDTELGEYTYRDSDSRIRAVDDPPTQVRSESAQTAVQDDAQGSSGQDDRDPSDDEGSSAVASTSSLTDHGPDSDATLSPSEETIELSESELEDVIDGATETAQLEASGNESGGASGDSDPTMFMPPAEETASGTESNDVPAEAEQGCPGCGGELVDTRETDHLKAEDGTALPAPDEWYCSECGQGFNYSDGGDGPVSGSDGSGIAGTVIALVVGLAGAVLAVAGSNRNDEQEIETF